MKRFLPFLLQNVLLQKAEMEHTDIVSKTLHKCDNG